MPAFTTQPASQNVVASRKLSAPDKEVVDLRYVDLYVEVNALKDDTNKARQPTT